MKIEPKKLSSDNNHCFFNRSFKRCYFEFEFVVFVGQSVLRQRKLSPGVDAPQSVLRLVDAEPYGRVGLDLLRVSLLFGQPLVQRLLRIGQQRPPLLGEHHIPLGAGKEPHAEFPLQIADVPAGRGL